jgi:hypothetical protein
MMQLLVGSLAAVTLTLAGGNAQAITAVDIAGQAGMPAPLPTMGESVVASLRGDNKVEIVLSGHGREWPLLQQGAPGKFSQILPGTFSAGQDRHGCSTADFDGDDRPDIYCVRGACEGMCTNSYPNELYLQRTDNSFAKVAGAWGAADPHGRGRGSVALDYDKDGDADLLVVNEKSTRYPDIGNHLYRNTGGQFVEVTVTPLRHTIGTMSAVVVPKPTGYPDVALETTNGVIYHKNNSGTFAAGTRIGGTGTFDVDAADLDGDSRADLVIVRPSSLEVRLNDGGYNFPRANYTRSLSQGRDVALCNLDGNAGRDIYVVQGARPANQDFVLRNSGSGASYTYLPVPNVAKGHGDIATCVPGIPGGLGAAVLVTNGKWMSAGDDDLGPTRLVQLKP